MKIINLALGTALALLSLLQTSYAQTSNQFLWSDYLQKLETNPSEQSEIWRHENQKTNFIFNQSKNKAFLNTTIGNLFNQERVLQWELLTPNT